MGPTNYHLLSFVLPNVGPLTFLWLFYEKRNKYLKMVNMWNAWEKFWKNCLFDPSKFHFGFIVQNHYFEATAEDKFTNLNYI